MSEEKDNKCPEMSVANPTRRATKVGRCPTDMAPEDRSQRTARVLAAMAPPERMQRQLSRRSWPGGSIHTSMIAKRRIESWRNTLVCQGRHHRRVPPRDRD